MRNILNSFPNMDSRKRERWFIIRRIDVTAEVFLGVTRNSVCATRVIYKRPGRVSAMCISRAYCEAIKLLRHITSRRLALLDRCVQWERLSCSPLTVSVYRTGESSRIINNGIRRMHFYLICFLCSRINPVIFRLRQPELKFLHSSTSGARKKPNLVFYTIFSFLHKSSTVFVDIHIK